MIEVWDAVRGEHVRTISDCVYNVDFSPDGQQIASASSGTVKVWDATTGRELLTLPGRDRMECVAFSPNGRLIASGSFRGTIRLWDVTTGEEICTLRGHKKTVYSVAFNRDGTRIVSGSADRTIKVWPVETTVVDARPAKW
jgi:WD40 repeat protein